MDSLEVALEEGRKKVLYHELRPGLEALEVMPEVRERYLKECLVDLEEVFSGSYFCLVDQCIPWGIKRFSICLPLEAKSVSNKLMGNSIFGPKSSIDHSLSKSLTPTWLSLYAFDSKNKDTTQPTRQLMTIACSCCSTRTDSAGTNGRNAATGPLGALRCKGTDLSLAALRGDEELVEALLSSGAVDTANFLGVTAAWDELNQHKQERLRL